MITCKNCGYDSHCGIPLIKDIRINAELDNGHSETEQIEVCKYCRCEKCTKSEWGNPTTDME
mgnify:CR=1 FL=1|jgi:hypothetical protein|tara:strand:- start:327 stop:512 length:186 start_codon:yes stop_codon:yes gene_type:complete